MTLAGMRQSLEACEDIVVVAECTRIGDLLAQIAYEEARGYPPGVRE